MTDYHIDEDDCESFHFDGQPYLFEYTDEKLNQKVEKRQESNRRNNFAAEWDLLVPDLENRRVHGRERSQLCNYNK